MFNYKIKNLLTLLLDSLSEVFKSTVKSLLSLLTKVFNSLLGILKISVSVVDVVVVVIVANI